ncbi:hypothetical protein BB561_002031 [Smittium simulii]|uniref:Uncharacterized protein n=1 Tax=Smittium simulii TaxID=133385 RepID=A0A2T9YS18_9FUNG|nr:hypothetical protein BB561_002031 [Smittium simulii]
MNKEHHTKNDNDTAFFKPDDIENIMSNENECAKLVVHNLLYSSKNTFEPMVKLKHKIMLEDSKSRIAFIEIFKLQKNKETKGLMLFDVKDKHLKSSKIKNNFTKCFKVAEYAVSKLKNQ